MPASGQVIGGRKNAASTRNPRYQNYNRHTTLLSSISGDEYVYFGAGETLTTFDIGELRFGIIICYDNHFPELALLHSLNHVDLLLAPHAARTGVWPDELTPEFCAQTIRRQQDAWQKVHRARAFDHNVYVLLNNAVGSSIEGLEGVVANHAGTVMGLDPL